MVSISVQDPNFNMPKRNTHNSVGNTALIHKPVQKRYLSTIFTISNSSPWEYNNIAAVFAALNKLYPVTTCIIVAWWSSVNTSPYTIDKQNLSMHKKMFLHVLWLFLDELTNNIINLKKQIPMLMKVSEPIWKINIFVVLNQLSMSTR